MMYSRRRGKALCVSLSEFFGVYSLHTRDHCCMSDVKTVLYACIENYMYILEKKATAVKEGAVSHSADEFEI